MRRAEAIAFVAGALVGLAVTVELARCAGIGGGMRGFVKGRAR